MIFKLKTKHNEGLVWGEDETDIHSWAKDVLAWQLCQAPYHGSYIITSQPKLDTYNVRFRYGGMQTEGTLTRMYNEYNKP
jgi:hypothetical protein